MVLNSINNTLGKYYTMHSKNIAESMSKIASGQRLLNSSQDFSGFKQAAQNTVELTAYNAVKQNLQSGQSLIEYAKELAVDIIDDLDRMKELTSLYETESVRPGFDQTLLDEYTSEFDALKTSIDHLVSTGYYDGIKVVDAGTLKSITITPSSNPVVNFDISFNAQDIIDTSSLDITDANEVDSQMLSAKNYYYKADGYYKTIQRQMALTDTIISNKESISESILQINENAELTKITASQIRLQATAALMAQANINSSYIQKLYGGQFSEGIKFDWLT